MKNTRSKKRSKPSTFRKISQRAHLRASKRNASSRESERAGGLLTAQENAHAKQTCRSEKAGSQSKNPFASQASCQASAYVERTGERHSPETPQGPSFRQRRAHRRDCSVLGACRVSDGRRCRFPATHGVCGNRRESVGRVNAESFRHRGGDTRAQRRWPAGAQRGVLHVAPLRRRCTRPRWRHACHNRRGRRRGGVHRLRQ